MRTRALLVALTALVAVPAAPQEHFTQGPVWVIDFYRIGDDQFDNYMKYLRSSVVPQDEEGKKQGLILETKTFLQQPRDPNDWNIAFARLYRNAAEALDYTKERDDKEKAIAAKQYQTTDEDKQREIIKPRLEMRRYIGTSMVREVMLKPMTK
jgi:hypothetical protein